MTRTLGVWFACAALALTLSPALAADTAFVNGTVVGRPVPSRATVTVEGNNIVRSVTADERGAFILTLPLGSYLISAKEGERTGHVRVDLGTNGATIAIPIAIATLKEIGRVITARASPIRGSGSDTTLTNELLTRSPANGSFPALLAQLPGAARGANGVVHLNGDHGDVNYIVDGVPIPQALNRNVGTEFDPNDVAFADIIEGAYPAQYGERFGGIVNITTRSGSGPPGVTGDVRLGSYNEADATLGYHAPLGRGGGIALAFRNQRSTRALDGPDLSSPHNAFAATNQLLHATIPIDASDTFNATVTHNHASYQIPNYVSKGEPGATDDNESQDDTFVNLQFRHAIGDSGLLTFGPAVKVSRIRDFGDPANDFSFGAALNGNAGGTPTDCATARATGNFSPTTCGYSLASDRTASDFRLASDYVRRTGRHDVRAGLAYDFSDVGKRYAVTLQPGNFLAPMLTPGTPGAATTVLDATPNAGTTDEAYLQDAWLLGDRYQIDYGLRYDRFTISSSHFDRAFTQFSPRMKLTRFFGSRASAYVYYGRFFTPFSLENVDPVAAQELNLPNQPTLVAFDLRPERDSLLEAGGHIPIGRGSLGLRVWQKNASDIIDDTQVGVTLLHQDINYGAGRISSQSVAYQLPLERNGRIYASFTHTLSFNAGCETQLLAPCFGSPSGFTPADHDQRVDVVCGMLLNDRRDGWLGLDGEYGSGLSSASCPLATRGYCKRTPHLTFDVEKGVGLGLGHDLALTLRIRNVLNDRYFVTLMNAQGDHYAPPRTFDLGIRFGR